MKLLYTIVLLLLKAGEVNSQGSRLVEIPHCPGGTGCPKDNGHIPTSITALNTSSCPRPGECWNENDAIAFVGEVISITRGDKSYQDFLTNEENKDRELEGICGSRIFEYKYEVKESSWGSVAGKTIEFINPDYIWKIPWVMTLLQVTVSKQRLLRGG